jgi:hypothetical protein
MRLVVGVKSKKEHVISARYTESEYLDVLMKITDADGTQMMSPGAFSKAATLGGRVTISDTEVERYKAFVLSKISNNMNQIAKGLNTDRLAGCVPEETHISVLMRLEEIKDEITKLMEPLTS